LWGSKTTTDKGKKLEDFLSQEGLCIFNDGTDTYLHPGNGSYSAIDVGCFPNRRSAFLRFLMASLHSSLNHGFPGCFGFVEVFGIVSSAINITVSLKTMV
jgi:hypothetical protein